MRSYRFAALAAVLASAVAACGSPSGPAPSGATFALRSVDAQELPAALSHTAGGRLVEVVGGSLTFETLVASGGVTGYAEIRITDPGAESRVELRELSGSSVRRGRALEVQYASGASETFTVEEGGTALRTVAARCAPGVPCLDILRVNRYERVTPPAAP